MQKHQKTFERQGFYHDDNSKDNQHGSRPCRSKRSLIINEEGPGHLTLR